MISLNIIIISLFNTWNKIAESQGKLFKLETCLIFKNNCSTSENAKK